MILRILAVGDVVGDTLVLFHGHHIPVPRLHHSYGRYLNYLYHLFGEWDELDDLLDEVHDYFSLQEALHTFFDKVEDTEGGKLG